jgi:adenylate cyclase
MERKQHFSLDSSMLLRSMNTSAHLNHLLRQRCEAAAIDRIKIDAEIWQTFGQTQAVLVLDMDGFSKTANHQGILEALTRINQMQHCVIPCIRSGRGQLIKAEADNIFAIFSHVSEAVAAAQAIFQTTAELGIGVSIGIGYGNILLIENPGYHDDFFGDEINLASKLGEDTAQSGELMLTEAAYKQLPSDAQTWREFELTISGLTMTAYQYQQIVQAGLANQNY